MIFLFAAFLGTALLYASVGFGGGSTYTALLALSGIDYRLMPVISLLCNVIVVTGGTIRFARAGLLPWRRVLPLVLVSAPFALAGGLTPIKQQAFLTLLGVTLLVAGVMLLMQREEPNDVVPRANTLGDLAVGAGVGYLSGLVGIGGGIFLAPILHLTRWGKAREIAGTASVFILVNSVAGLVGQVSKLSPVEVHALGGWWPLGLGVLVGGQIGSLAGIRLFSPSLVRRATGVLIVYVAIQLLWRVLG